MAMYVHQQTEENISLPLYSLSLLSLPKWVSIQTSRQKIIDFQYVVLNAAATVVVVFLNKYTFEDSQLRQCQILVAAYHFFATFLVLLTASQWPFRIFKAVRLPLLKVLPLSIFFASFLILNNVSLTYNPIGFYQLSKIMTTPTVVLISFLLFGTTISGGRLAAVIMSCVGVGLASSTSLESNPFGTVVACAAFTATACYQIWIGKKISDLEVEASQLLLNQAFTASLLLLPVSLAVDKLPNFSSVPSRSISCFLAGGLVASLINLSQFMIIGRTSALTFNIVSNLKMVAILALGWYTEGKKFTAYDTLGVSMAVFGAWYYAMQGKKKV